MQQDVFPSKHLTAMSSNRKKTKQRDATAPCWLLPLEAQKRKSLFPFSSLASWPQSLHDCGCFPVLFSVDLIDFPSPFPLQGIPSCCYKPRSNTLSAQAKLIMCALRGWRVLSKHQRDFRRETALGKHCNLHTPIKWTQCVLISLLWEIERY